VKTSQPTRSDIQRRLLCKADAAAYCGMSIPTFERLCPVAPISFGEDVRLLRFDVRKLDQWIDGLTPQGGDSLTETDCLRVFDGGQGNDRKGDQVARN